jgi:hypothetical protein
MKGILHSGMHHRRLSVFLAALFLCLTLSGCPLPSNTMQTEEYRGGFTDRSGKVCVRLSLDSNVPLQTPYSCRATPGAAPQLKGVMSYVYDFVRCKVEEATQNIFNALTGASWYRTTLMACATLAIALFSLMMMVGIQSMSWRSSFASAPCST